MSPNWCLSALIQFWPWMKKDGGGKKVPGSVLALIDGDPLWVRSGLLGSTILCLL